MDAANPEPDDEALVILARRGDASALAALFDRHRKRLGRMIRLRLDRRLQGRVDPSDILQEAYLDLAEELHKGSDDRDMPAFLWLRLVAGQRLVRVHRRHLGAAMRDAGREVSLHHGAMPGASSASLAAHLLGRFTSASQAMARAEARIRLQEAINGLDPIDREVIALRHFEEMSNVEVAAVLGLEPPAASKRHIRALKRLQVALRNVPGLFDRPI